VRHHLLTVNVGSSSVKIAVFENVPDLPRVAAAEVVRLGSNHAELKVATHGQADRVHPMGAADHRQAVGAAIEALGSTTGGLKAVVHRVVHGGDATAPQWIDQPLLDRLEALRPFASEHLPPAIDAIAAMTTRYPDIRQAACFDTAFHAALPPVARAYPLPRRFAAAGVRRYGFHGLSCESIMAALADAAPDDARGRIVIAHLGSGASLTAVREGRSVDTTMGFSPLGGVMMSTRPGDLDPGVLLYALEHERLDAAALRVLLTREAGLLGVSGRSRDMRDLIEAARTDSAAADAIALFCYTARKALGALLAVLGGLDTIVFTGGIGEHAAEVRAAMLGGLDGLGIRLDPDRNRRHAPVISADRMPTTVRVLRSDEDRVLAHHVAALLGEERP
jgi:acetate kinase